MPETPNGFDASFRYFSNLLEVRARKLPKRAMNRRLERTFIDLCRSLNPTLSLEIGAHEASFSVRMKEAVPSARCVAFEANPYVHEKFAGELATTGVEYLHLAVSETSGPVTLTIPRQIANNARGRDNRMGSIGGAHRNQHEAETVTVPSVPLDDFVALTDDDRVVAWIDVEGASGVVLSSARETLARTSLVYIEVENEQVWEGQWLDVDVARFLNELGLVPVFRDAERPHQYNIVFARGEIAADPEFAQIAHRVYRPHRGGGGGKQ